jgi:hypothetical protein
MIYPYNSHTSIGSLKVCLSATHCASRFELVLCIDQVLRGKFQHCSSQRWTLSMSDLLAAG